MNPRNGKIARLPYFLRDQLNERLECSEESPQLLDWLNALPEVRKIVKKDFDGVPISKQNLSQWRQGGFQEWLLRRDLCENAYELRELAENMADEDPKGVLADHAATVLAARFGSLIAHWNGEVDDAFEAKTRVLNRLCHSVVQLQRGMHRARREALEQERMREEKAERDQEELKDKLTAPLFDALKVAPLAGSFGGGEAGRKIARYILAIQRGRMDARLKLEPTDKFDVPAKTEPDNAAKPLQENEMDGGTEEQVDQNQSESVKVNQSDCARPNEDGLGVGLRLELGTATSDNV
jgi:hypothetical protein